MYEPSKCPHGQGVYEVSDLQNVEFTFLTAFLAVAEFEVFMLSATDKHTRDSRLFKTIDVLSYDARDLINVLLNIHRAVED